MFIRNKDTAFWRFCSQSDADRIFSRLRGINIDVECFEEAQREAEETAKTKNKKVLSISLKKPEINE